jgi:hypothetical protein
MMRLLQTLAASLLLTSGLAMAGEKGMMHCFAFSVIPSATEADWKAFEEATDAWPSKFKGIHKVWHGKLRAPLQQFTVNAEASKGGAAEVDAKAKRLVREHGVCMLMENEGTLKEYTAQPYHKEWMAKYEKVRVAGTTTYDIIAK